MTVPAALPDVSAALPDAPAALPDTSVRPTLPPSSERPHP